MSIINRQIIRYTAGKTEAVEDAIAAEAVITFYVNGEEYLTVTASPGDVYELAAGLLWGDGLIQCINDIAEFRYDELDKIVFINLNRPFQKVDRRIVLSGCGRSSSANYLKQAAGFKPVPQETVFIKDDILEAVSVFSRWSGLFTKTGAVHSAALVSGHEIIAMFEDISRHNAIDKLFGHILMKKIDIKGKWLATSGRISSDMVFKLVKAKMELAASMNAPLSTALELADILGITIAGFVRGRRLNIYTGAGRLG